MDKICVDYLIFEVTKRCNMSCEHHLRGDARDVDLTRDIVDTVLDKIDFVGSITFTGGEPSLNLPIIEYIFSELRRRDISYGYFRLATNGLSNQLELANILMAHYIDAEEPALNAVTLSIDQYHDDVTAPPLKLLTFYTGDKEVHGRTQLINRGRAYENGLDAEDCGILTAFSVTDTEDDGSIHAIETMYVDAKGRLYADCNMSYEDQDSYPAIDAAMLSPKSIEAFNKANM